MGSKETSSSTLKSGVIVAEYGFSVAFSAGAMAIPEFTDGPVSGSVAGFVLMETIESAGDFVSANGTTVRDPAFA